MCRCVDYADTTEKKEFLISACVVCNFFKISDLYGLIMYLRLHFPPEKLNLFISAYLDGKLKVSKILRLS